MKLLPYLLSSLLLSPLMADEAKPNLDDPAKLEKTLAEALNLSVIEKRGEEGELNGLHTEWDGNGKVTSQTKWENGEELEKVK